MSLKQFEEREKFPGQEKVALGVVVEMISELIKSGLGDAFRAGGIEMPVEERHHPVRPRGPEQIRPVYVLLKQGSDPRNCFGGQAGPGAAEEQSGFRTNVCQGGL